MKVCSLVRNMKIEKGCAGDYEKLSRFHYREGNASVYMAIFVLRASKNLKGKFVSGPIGVICYTMPTFGLELRGVATGGIFNGLSRSLRMRLLNKNVRCINRVIIDPRFRGLGLASRLVRETRGKVGVPIVEAMAVMGAVNPFFEKAGMKAYKAGMPVQVCRLVEAFSLVGIERELLIDAEDVNRKLESLGKLEANFIEAQMGKFLGGYGKNRERKKGLERTRYILGKLTDRPVYYIWFNPEKKLITE